MSEVIEMVKPVKPRRQADPRVKLQTPTWPEVREAYRFAVEKLSHQVDDMGGDGQRLAIQGGPVLNYVVIWFLAQPRKKQIEIVRAGKMGASYLMDREFDPAAEGVFEFDLDKFRAAWDAKYGSEEGDQDDAADRHEHSTAHSQVVHKPHRQKRQLRA